MIGDVIGDPGMEVLGNRLPHLIKQYSADFVTVNGENAAAGFGLTAPLLEKIFAAGADVVTGGNHIWEQREFWPVLETEKRVLRPMNYPDSAGRGWVKIEKSFAQSTDMPDPVPIHWLVVNLQGREYMPSLINCPFKTFDAFEAGLGHPANLTDPLLTPEGKLPEYIKDQSIILVDFHAETSREKEALGFYLDGRVSIIAGTHTHVQTADERILPGGTAYITDLGMTGAIDGVIGMDTKICVDRARHQVLYRMEVAATAGGGNTAVQGIVAEINSETRKAVSIKRISA